MTPIGELVRGKKGLIVGIANEGSIAFGCGRVLHRLGGEDNVAVADLMRERLVPRAGDMGAA